MQDPGISICKSIPVGCSDTVERQISVISSWDMGFTPSLAHSNLWCLLACNLDVVIKTF